MRELLGELWKPLHLPLNEALKIEVDWLEELARDQGPSMRLMLWTTQTALVVPKRLTVSERFEHACQTSRSLGYPVFTRASGGDVTPQGSGILNISLAFRFGRPDGDALHESYLGLIRPVTQALKAVGVTASYGEVAGAFCDGAYNITIDARKFAGTAQRWKASLRSGEYCVLAHALLLVHPPNPLAIDAINSFYEAIGSAKRIEGGVHIGLTEASNRKNLVRKFLRSLIRNFRKQGATICGPREPCLPQCRPMTHA